ncbi:MAG: tRNA uridine-5-carboxymethylaminomethyl(34) synthesis GTPase MnmE [Gammaproteobacteria bacterium]|nr:tRNA uridine-5-carboxymethylaminomethyl(34) synthesis GTPase MnmE [Gammaproteobacteria bacterium]
MMRAADTIAAIATPAGRGGIGIVRVSGPASRNIAAAVAGGGIEARRVSHRAFRGADGAVIDHGVVVLFAAPASYTGEDVLELHGHGGTMVPHLLLRRVLELGARPARPGEFTERAFLNGRMDLLQAEAVADLVDSQSERAARSAARALEGEFSRQIGALQGGLVSLRVNVEAALDFPDEQLDVSGSHALQAGAHAWLQRLQRIQAAARAGHALRAGCRVVIVGAPNVGKSSLLNCLIGVDRAIVAATPGTTRDTVESETQLGGIRAAVVDTAGIRATTDTVEREGVRRTQRALDEADMAIVVSEYAGARPPAEVLACVGLVKQRVWVRNKIDLCGVEPEVREGPDGWEVALCARSGAGIELLRDILGRIAAGDDTSEDVLLARARHLHALDEAGAAVRRMLDVAGQGDSLELAAEELRLAHSALGWITGAVSADDLLAEIFSRFCIGK